MLNLLPSHIGKTLIQLLSQKTGQSTDKTSNVLLQAMPLLLEPCNATRLQKKVFHL
uniref:DUF937 domain-containing protein n=1 Tax=Nonlabens sp. Ci31 TaxID=2608253 RepID=UPI00397743BB